MMSRSLQAFDQAEPLSRQLQDVRDVRTVAVFDTYATSFNAGDAIIMDSVWAELRAIFDTSVFVTIPTHDHPGPQAYRALDAADLALVGGTNLLASHMDQYKQWKVAGAEMLRLRNLVLMGVGWWQYQDEPNLYTRSLLRTILHPTRLHSVRDGYTERKLRSIGIDNVVNTGCPTTWRLGVEHCASIPVAKGESVLLTFTDYKPNIEADRYLYAILRRHYGRVIFWLQGRGDWVYAKEILDPDVEVVGGTLAALDRVLTEIDSIDYVGTRLHAGVRALQHGRRSLILAVDNRATEMGHDMNLPVIDRENAGGIESAVAADRPTRVKLPEAAIARWKSQFLESAE